MAEITFISGGCRSGKSTYAEQIILADDKPHIYLATCPPAIGADMDERILRHKESRRDKNWRTIEEEIDLASVIRTHKKSAILVDCLTLWINNLMWQAEQSKREISEKDIYQYCCEILEACRESESSVVFVSNETGMGIMPINKAARLFGDLAGRCNQTFAQAADNVVFMVSGLPLKLKEKPSA